MTRESAEDLYDNAPCGYLSAAPDGTIVRVNTTFLHWTGYRREELVDLKRFQDLLTVGGRIYHETHYAPLLRMQGAVREIAVNIVRSDGSRLPALINSVLVDGPGDPPQIVRTTVFDATDRKRYERELLAARDRERVARERSESLYERERDVAHALQQSLLAGTPPVDPRFAVATAYIPALEHLEVGGDWHDAFMLPDGGLGITVGDVVGRGIGAASAMGQLRSAVRALAGAGFAPATVIEHLDTFTEQNDTARYATLVYAAIDPATGLACCASAGHLPPLLLPDGGAPTFFMDGRSPPLGVPLPDSDRAQASFTLAPGDGFLLYTDGLVERRGETIDAGLARLLEAVRERPGAAPAELVAALPDALIDRSASGDDVCLLGFRRLLSA